MDSPAKLWILKSKGSKSAFQGNSGYDDQIDAHYLYDTTVKNHDKLSEGDYILLANKYHILGAARIDEIAVRSNVAKKRFRCPHCNTQEHYSRQSISPMYRCRNKHEFDVPDQEDILVDEYQANYSNSFVAFPPKFSVKSLEGFYIRRNRYYSIQQADPEFLSNPGMPDIPAPQLKYPELGDYAPSLLDSRAYRVSKSFFRPSQDRFRTALLSIYDAKCMLSGCTVPLAIEACHICPYKGEPDNHPANGLLLRKDLHALFDADLIGIHPETLEISLAPSLRKTDYHSLSGRRLNLPKGGPRPSKDALSLRWKAFQELLRSGL